MIGRPLVFILPSGGTVCPESRSNGLGNVTCEYIGNILKRKKKEKIKERLSGVNIGSSKKGRQMLGSGLVNCELGGIYIVNVMLRIFVV